MNKPRTLLITILVLAAAASRLIPHPPNFAPITALALFSGANFSREWLAFVIPLSALLLSDVVLGFYRQMWIVYGSFCLIASIGLLLRNRTSANTVAGASLVSSLLFFFLTNLCVWVFGSLYPKTAEGLVTCFVAALPFLQNTIMGDGFYAVLLFGALHIAETKWPVIREAA